MTFIFCSLFTTLLSFQSFAQSTANPINYFEDFNSAGYPTNIPAGSYWTFHNEIHPSQNSWNQFFPGDGNAYITVDADVNNDTDWIYPFQTLEFGGVAQNHRLEVRMKGAVVDGGLVGFLFTYKQVGEIFNEVDIEVVARDRAVPSHETLPLNSGWTDARFNTWGNANENTNEQFTGTMKPVVNQLNEKISLIDNQFHTYTIDWRDNRIDFFIDGVIQETITTSIASGVSEVIIGFRQLPWAGSFNWSGTHTMVIDYLKIEPLENTTFALNDTFVADEDRTASFNVLANDSSNTSIFSFDNLSAQGFPITANGNLLSYTPSGGFLGQDSFNYTIQDSNGVQATAIARITVQDYIEPLNANTDSITVAPGSSNTPINVIANDFYGPSGPHPSHPITLPGGKTVTASNNGGAIAVVNGKVNYTPKIGFTGIDTFTYTITDAKGFADTAIVTITVGGNIPAVANNDAFVVVNNSATNLNVLANDTGSGLSILSFDAISAKGFSLTRSNTALTYTPTGGFTGNDSFSYTIADSNGVQSTANVALTVNQVVVVAGPITAVNDAITVAPGSLNTPVNVTTNDSFGINGPHPSYPLTLTNGKVFHASNKGGDISIVNGKVNYSAPNGFTGIDTFTYTITDSKGFAAQGIVTVTVGGNIPAVANNDAFVVVNNSATNLNVLANDTGSGLSILSFDAISAKGFSLTRSNTALTYTPTGGFTGNDSFSYTIADSNGVQSTANVALTVNQVVVVAGPITAVNDAITVAPGSLNTPVDVIANDSFGINGPHPLHALTLTNGKVFHASNKGGNISIVNGKVNYSAPNGFTGIDSFTYTITDSKGFARQGVVTVTVNTAVGSRTVSKPKNKDTIIENEFSIVENSFVTYPNPSRGYLKTSLSSGLSTQATVYLIDVTGKVVHSSAIKLEKGMNTFEMNVALPAGIVFMKILSSEINFGTTKIIFD